MSTSKKTNVMFILTDDQGIGRGLLLEAELLEDRGAFDVSTSTMLDTNNERRNN